jgi:hypothetical protein
VTGIATPTLEAGRLVDEARLAAGAEPGEPLRFLDGLGVLTTALEEEARLSERGRAGTRAALLGALVTQLRVARAVKSRPPVARPPAVFITGLLRTGTTFLHNLLAQHPDLRAPRLWELMSVADPRPPRERIRGCAAYVEEYYRAAPDFRAIHPLDPQLPEECHRLTANSFRHFIYGLRYNVPSYMDWLDRQPMAAAYHFHQLQLDCLLSADPEPAAAVVLKCPSHLWHLDDLDRVYPGATVIRLHRDPKVAIGSVCSLTAAVRAARSDDVSPSEIGAHWLDRAARALEATHPGGAPIDVRYADLVADPLRVVAGVCERIGVPVTAAARDRMTRYLAAGADKPATTHRYRLGDFGIDGDRLDRRLAAYRAAFDV